VSSNRSSVAVCVSTSTLLCLCKMGKTGGFLPSGVKGLLFISSLQETMVSTSWLSPSMLHIMFLPKDCMGINPLFTVCGDTLSKGSNCGDW
jgi:hypothetical protein